MSREIKIPYMNWLFFKKKKKRLKLLTNFYHSLQGDPFLTEEIILDGDLVKIEFYYLEQSKYYNALFQSRQFAVWTANQGVCRLLVDKDYYQHFAALYQKKINIFWLEFMTKVYQKEISLINRIKIAFGLVFLPCLLVVFLTLSVFQNKNRWFLWIPLIILLIFIFMINHWIKNKQKQLAFFQDQELKKTLEKIKKDLGETFFANLIEQQKKYNPEYKPLENEAEKDDNLKN